MALPPGLRGFMLARQQGQQEQAQQLGMLGQLAGIQGQMAQQQLAQETFAEKQRQQEALRGLIPQLTDPAARMLAQAGKFGDAVSRQFPQPQYKVVDGNLVAVTPQGVSPMFTAQPKPQLVETGVEGQPGVTQRGWAVPGQPSITPLGAPKLPEILNPAVQAARRDIARSGASRTNVNVNPMRETFKDEQALRNEYTDASKSFVKLAEGYSKVKGALASDPTTSAPATMAAATQFMKMLDPDSVVRESELGMALNAAGVWDRFTNIYNTVQSGKVLTPTQAKEFGRIADVVYDAANRAQQGRVQHFKGLAQSYNFDPERVVPDLTPRQRRATDSQPTRKYNPVTGKIE